MSTAMKLIDLYRESVRGVAVFTYRGYTISCTTIPSRPELAVYHNATSYWNDRFPCTAEGIREAMAHIDTLPDRSA